MSIAGLVTAMKEDQARCSATLAQGSVHARLMLKEISVTGARMGHTTVTLTILTDAPLVSAMVDLTNALLLEVM